jgi:phosphomannomutase / phosphoglucomutase
VNPQIFRENDIRGEAARDLDDATVAALGAVLGRRSAALSNGAAVVVGCDGRLHSPRLFEALTRGILAHAPVLDLGVVPTPVVSFAARTLAPPVAVMITGSHNPAADNGFKISIGGESIHGSAVVELRAEVEAELARTAGEPEAAAANLPRFAITARSLEHEYLDAAAAALSLGPRRFKLVVDAGNGVGGPLALALYRRLGFEVVPLYCEPDGSFPHHHPDPTVAENLTDLAALVVSSGAELGLGLDGDADRLGVVDAERRIVWGDQLLVLFGKALLAEVPGAGIVAEVKCSQATFEALAAAGASIEMWKVGHSLLKARMKQTGALLAGEMSGHFFFAHRWLGFDDGIYAGARLLELLSHSSLPLAQHVDQLPSVFNTPELRLPCADDRKADVVAEVAEALRHHPDVRAVVEIDGVRASFDGGWALMRASTTQPIVVMRYEADSPARLTEIERLVTELAAPGLKAPKT